MHSPSQRTPLVASRVSSLKQAQYYGLWVVLGVTLLACVHLTLNTLVDRRIDHALSGIKTRELHPMAEYAVNTTNGERPSLFHNSGREPKPTVPISLVIPCQSEDFYLLPMVLQSLANQTVFPHETLLVLNLPPKDANGTTLMTFNFDTASLAENFARLRSEADKLPSRKSDAKVATEYVVKTRVPLEWSLLEIPNLKLMVRSGKFYAGSNRMYGARNIRGDSKFVSFFDCDDYLHPKRTEYVYRTFEEQPDLEALIHGFSLVTFTQWDEQFPEFHKQVDYMPEHKTFLWPYETIWKSLPVDKFKNETNGEPRQTSDSLWFFPRDMKLPRYPPYPTMGHNAWITIKRQVLEEVPYPETLPRGQDSLYNWRLIAAKKKWNHLPLRLAAYVRPR